MIITYFVVFACLIFGGLTYYVGYTHVYSAILTELETIFPSYYSSGGAQGYLTSALYWIPLLAILFPLLLWVIVQSQIPERYR